MTVLHAFIILLLFAVLRFGVPAVIMFVTNAFVQWRLGINNQ